MVYCTECGTQNRDGSKFCNNCGARLTPPPSAAPAPAAQPEERPAVDAAAETGGFPAWIEHLGEAERLPGEEAELAPRPPEPEKSVPPEPPESGIPDWLVRLRANPPEAEEAPPPAPAADDVPDWIEQLQAQAPAVETPPGPGAGWLEELRAQPPTETETPKAEAPTLPPVEPSPGSETRLSEIPLWFEELPWDLPAEAKPEAALSEEVLGEPPAGLEPLSEIQASAEPPSVAAAPEVPTWLEAWRRAPTEETEPIELPAQEQVAPAPEEPPAPVEPAVPPAQPPVSAVSGVEPEPAPAESEGIPDWLRLAMPAEQVAEHPEQPIATTAEMPQAEAEEQEPEPIVQLPTWITAIKPMSVASQAAELTGEPAEVSGPLAGLRGVLKLASAVVGPRPSVKTIEPPEKQDAAHLFESSLAEPLAETETPAQTRRRPAWTIRPVIYILLALAVLIPFVLPAGFHGWMIPISHTPAAEFYELVQSIPPNRIVLIAFDYDPSVAGEMNLQAAAIVRDLMQRRVKIIALSTLDTGPQLAQSILETAAAQVADYQYGADYLNLGYLPGHEAGVAQLATRGWVTEAKDYSQGETLSRFPLTANSTLQDVALVIELAGSEEPLRMWLEQFRPRANIPLAVGASAAAEPQARAYRDAGQLAAALSGLIGAAQYEILSSRTGLAVSSADAQGLGQLALVLIILLGNVLFWFSQSRRKEHD